MAVACRTVCGEDEALICEMRAGVVPSPNAVGAGKPGRVFALIGQVARLCDDKGAAAKAESIFPATPAGACSSRTSSSFAMTGSGVFSIGTTSCSKH
jgi:hypothetical protein